QREPEPVPEHVHAVPGVGVVVMTTVVLAATPAMVTMSCVFKRLYDHLLLRVLRVAGLGGSRVVVVVMIMTVVAMFVHARPHVRVAGSPLMIGSVVPACNKRREAQGDANGRSGMRTRVSCPFISFVFES